MDLICWRFYATMISQRVLAAIPQLTGCCCNRHRHNMPSSADLLQPGANTAIQRYTSRHFALHCALIQTGPDGPSLGLGLATAAFELIDQVCLVHVE